ncbi:MAG TPA: metallophosphoesterase family protein [Gemmatimonadaceae bacterium]|nr:metallophosphoesterase family protein [Gemmatimonadaceae bacterium]
MRVAALYDIHGNLPALEAVLADVRELGVDKIVVGGDVFPGPLAIQCLDLLLDLDTEVHFIRGNGDRVVLEQSIGIDPAEMPEPWREVIRWNGLQLLERHVEALTAWPLACSLTIGGLGKVLFCHATPRNDMDVFTRLSESDKLTEIFDSVDASSVVCGHTHMQFDRSISGKRVINAGSVGMPFAEPGAYWLVLDDHPALKRTAYDYSEAAERIRQSGYPQAEQFASANVLAPPTEQQMLEAYTKVGLK